MIPVGLCKEYCVVGVCYGSLSSTNDRKPGKVVFVVAASET